MRHRDRTATLALNDIAQSQLHGSVLRLPIISYKRKRDSTSASDSCNLPQNAKVLFQNNPSLNQANMRLLQDSSGLLTKTELVSLSSKSQSSNVDAIKRACRRRGLKLDIPDDHRPPELQAHLKSLDEAIQSRNQKTQFISTQARELVKDMRVRHVWANEAEMLRRYFRHLKSPKPEPAEGHRKLESRSDSHLVPSSPRPC